MGEDTQTPGLFPAGESGSAAVLFSAERTRVVLSGEVDAALSAELSEAISDAQRAELPVDVDVRHVTFMDSSGAAMLARLAARVPHRVRIIQPPDVVRFLLEVTAIGDAVDVIDFVPQLDVADGGTAPTLAVATQAPAAAAVSADRVAAARPSVTASHGGRDLRAGAEAHSLES